MPHTYIRAVRPGAVGRTSPVAVSVSRSGRPRPGSRGTAGRTHDSMPSTLPSAFAQPGGREVGVVDHNGGRRPGRPAGSPRRRRGRPGAGPRPAAGSALDRRPLQVLQLLLRAMPPAGGPSARMPLGRRPGSPRMTAPERDLVGLAARLAEVSGVIGVTLGGWDARRWVTNEKGGVRAAADLPGAPADFENRVAAPGRWWRKQLRTGARARPASRRTAPGSSRAPAAGRPDAPRRRPRGG